MKIVNASYEILTPISEGGIEELKYIEQIARKCYRSNDAITEDGESAKRMIKSLVKNKHFAMLEHSMLSVSFISDRAFSHELVRHRMASFAQESQRYVNYSKEKFGNEITFINPCYFSKHDDVFLNNYMMWTNAMQTAEEYYFALLKNGATPQEARSVLPNSTKTEITITCNYREWREIFSLRVAGTTGKPSPQMLEVMVPLLKELQSKIPIIFDDIEVNE